MSAFYTRVSKDRLTVDTDVGQAALITSASVESGSNWGRETDPGGETARQIQTSTDSGGKARGKAGISPGGQSMVRSNEMGVVSSWWSMESNATTSHGQGQGARTPRQCSFLSLAACDLDRGRHPASALGRGTTARAARAGATHGEGTYMPLSGHLERREGKSANHAALSRTI